MILGFNFQLLIATFFIPLVYASIIYFTSPYKSVSFRRGLIFLWGGMTSTMLVQMFYFFIPHLSASHSDFYKLFAIVGPLEEISKLIMFYLVLHFTKDRKVSSHPARYMFYFAMVGLGFAISENIHYMQRYGTWVLTTRLFTSTIAHMIFGLLLGYWAGLGTIVKRKFEDRSIFGVIAHKHKNLKKFTYVFCGIFVASFYHGMYNYNLATSLFSSKIILIMILSFGLIFSKLLANDLSEKWKNREIKGDKKLLK